MRFKRSERIQELLLEEISLLIQKGLKDPRIGFATVSKIEVSENLKHAKVFISIIGDEKEKEETLEGLNSAKGYIRNALGKNLCLRYIPQLDFKMDNTMEYLDKINKLIKKANLAPIHDERNS
ncbi:MAG: 30S ribosome-binding factor RbfA [Nitrospinales bacterium]